MGTRGWWATVGVALVVLGGACSDAGSAEDNGFASINHEVTRLDFDVPVPFDEFRATFEAAVPAADPAKLKELGSWEAIVAKTPELAPNGFLRYGSIDVGAVFKLAGDKEQSVTYLMGNHTVAEKMYRHDPGVMLYAPLRTLIYEDLEGKVHFSVDQPSTRFASFDQDDITATGLTLDAKLGHLLDVLDLPVPETLTAESSGR